jgi:hypothetical protein
VSNATHATQSIEPPALAEGDASALSLGAALSLGGATLGAEVAAPPPVHAVRMNAAVAPSASSRVELRKVNSSSTTAKRRTDRGLSVTEDTLSTGAASMISRRPQWEE